MSTSLAMITRQFRVKASSSFVLSTYYTEELHYGRVKRPCTPPTLSRDRERAREGVIGDEDGDGGDDDDGV